MKNEFLSENPILREIRFRSTLAANSSRDGGVFNEGIDQHMFADFKINHPDSKHPLIDFLKEKPAQMASFSNLLEENDAINDLFLEENKSVFWKEQEGELYLSFEGMCKLFKRPAEIEN